MLNVISVDWAKISEAGIGVVAVIAIVILIAILWKGFLAVWNRSIDSQEKSTDAITKNTEAFNNLSNVFEKSHEREIEFQREALELLKDNNLLAKQTHEKVTDLHEKLK